MKEEVGEDIRTQSFQLFRIKPFGWGCSATHRRKERPSFQLFRIKPFGWEKKVRTIPPRVQCVSNYSELALIIVSATQAEWPASSVRCHPCGTGL